MIPNEDPSSEESIPPVGPDITFDKKPEPVEEELPLPESRRSRFLRRTIRWLAGLLIVFGIGAIAAIFFLYMPARQEINQLESRLEQASQEIAQLESRIDQLSSFEDQNSELQAAADNASLHVFILSVRTDVAVAQMYLAKADPTRARVTLSKTAQTLKQLESLLEPEARQRAVEMQDRLTLVVKELDENTFAAQSDLEVLSNDLIELENAYFAKP